MRISTLDAIRDAELPTLHCRGRPVLASVSKSLLWTLFSLSEEEHVSGRALAARSGCSQSTAYVALRCLTDARILRKTSPARGRQRYEIDPVRLRDFKSIETLSKPRSGPKKKEP